VLFVVHGRYEELILTVDAVNGLYECDVHEVRRDFDSDDYVTNAMYDDNQLNVNNVVVKNREDIQDGNISAPLDEQVSMVTLYGAVA
jgi:hypothetical protein